MLRALQGGSGRGVLLHGTFFPPLHPEIQPPPLPSSNAANCGGILIVALRSPKGFGPPVPKSPKPLSEEQKKEMRLSQTEKRQQRISDDEEEDEDDDEVPQIVMDRMIKRIGVSLSIPLLLAVLMFPFFWYLKVVLKLDIPEWLPLLVSGTFFGSSALGITYGIVSTSWDPLRDGSLLGWKEAKANWPIFFDNIQGKQGRR